MGVGVEHRRGILMRDLKTLVAAFILLSVSAASAQQVKLEAILKRVNDDFVTLIDVRQARLLKLVDPVTGADNDVAMRLVERKLELAEVLRAAPREITAQSLLARRREWESTLAGANVAELLRRAGMSDTALETWLRDDLRIRAYVDQVFGAQSVPTRAQMLAYYEAHIADYQKDGVTQDFDVVAPLVRRTLQDAKRAELVKAWGESLVGRADVR
jgi:hypothetical protein